MSNLEKHIGLVTKKQIKAQKRARVYHGLAGDAVVLAENVSKETVQEINVAQYMFDVTLRALSETTVAIQSTADRSKIKSLLFQAYRIIRELSRWQKKLLQLIGSLAMPSFRLA